MNWKKAKELFPNTWQEIKELGKETGLDGRFLLEKYCDLNNIEYGLLIIKPLKEHDNKKNNNP